MRRSPIPPFPCFCFAFFLLCVPMGYEFGAAKHRVAPIATESRASRQDRTPRLALVRLDGLHTGTLTATVSTPLGLVTSVLSRGADSLLTLGHARRR